jgi:hypothetical protein
VGEDTVRQATGDMCKLSSEVTGYQNCTFDDFIIDVYVPKLGVGSYDLSLGEATMTIRRLWDHQSTAEGCFCTVEPTLVDEPVLSGTIVIRLLNDGSRYMTLQDGPDAPRFGGTNLEFLSACR